MIKKTKKIKRRPGKSSNMYFTDETQVAIAHFQSCTNDKERHDVYLNKIHPAFDSLVENLILVYGFSSPGELIEELKSDCISFLYSSILKWSPEKGTKAFSYFNVVAKNFLIANTRKSIKRSRRHISMDVPELLSIEQSEDIEVYEVAPPPDDILIERERREELESILREIQCSAESENEQACIRAIISVFDRVDDLDFLNKRAIRIYVRDISGLSSKKLSIAMTSIRNQYRQLLSDLENII